MAYPTGLWLQVVKTAKALLGKQLIYSTGTNSWTPYGLTFWGFGPRIVTTYTRVSAIVSEAGGTGTEKPAESPALQTGEPLLVHTCPHLAAPSNRRDNSPFPSLKAANEKGQGSQKCH